MFDPLEISTTINRLHYLASEFETKAREIAHASDIHNQQAHQWADWLMRYAAAMKFYAEDAERIESVWTT